MSERFLKNDRQYKEYSKHTNYPIFLVMHRLTVDGGEKKVTETAYFEV